MDHVAQFSLKHRILVYRLADEFSLCLSLWLTVHKTGVSLEEMGRMYRKWPWPVVTALTVSAINRQAVLGVIALESKLLMDKQLNGKSDRSVFWPVEMVIDAGVNVGDPIVFENTVTFVYVTEHMIFWISSFYSMD